MFTAFAGISADEAWLKVAELLRRDQSIRHQNSRCGPTREILHATISIEDSKQRWVVSRAPACNPSYAFAELIWTVCGRNDAAFLTYFNPRLTKYAGTGPTFHGAYGFRLRNHLGLDQLKRAYNALEHCPDSRQVVLQIWDAKIDLPEESGIPTATDIPCNIVSLLKVRNGRLEWVQVMRSNDIFRGIPYDFVQFMSLQEILAGWLGVAPGCYHHVSDSLHAYESDLPNVILATPLSAAPNADSLALPYLDSEKVFAELSVAVEMIIDPNLQAGRLVDRVSSTELPAAFGNILRVLIAEGLRKRSELGKCELVMEGCTNPLYRQLWVRWLDRLRTR
ncbi:MAG: thymidylate synthase [Opitutaceae bacterium]|nr:thymidylate synthase [Opitutaceae bacterium]